MKGREAFEEPIRSILGDQRERTTLLPQWRRMCGAEVRKCSPTDWVQLSIFIQMLQMNRN